jgi:hypothetical protein
LRNHCLLLDYKNKQVGFANKKWFCNVFELNKIFLNEIGKKGLFS